MVRSRGLGRRAFGTGGAALGFFEPSIASLIGGIYDGATQRELTRPSFSFQACYSVDL